MCKFLLPIFVVLSSIGIGWFWFVLLGDLSPPVLDENPYWGHPSKKGLKEDTSIRPFKINIDEKILKDLKTRLALELSTINGSVSRLIPPLEGIGFEYGFNTNYLKTVAKYWLEKYDWKIREKLLNKYPNFKTTIAGIEIHFQHVKSTNNKKYKTTKPLLLLHGWPGSFIEFQKSIPLLIDPKNTDINFELIIPSLPGSGFSERSHWPGFGFVEMAQVSQKLMDRIGYKEYYVAGGDGGMIISSHMGALFPQNVKGIHINPCLSFDMKSTIKMVLASVYPTLFMTEEEAKIIYPLTEYFKTVFLEEAGYFHIQATKPDTVGASLSNSPTGLLAYILEKFSTWTNKEWRSLKNGGLQPYYNLDDLLDNIMVYWVTNSITSSMRIYSEGFFGYKNIGWKMDRVPVTIPSCCLQPPNDSWGGLPKWIIQHKLQNLQRHTIASKGGHFISFEAPEVFTNDVIMFFGALEKSATASKNSKIN